MALIENLIAEGKLKTPRIIRAFQSIHRADFLPEVYGNSRDMLAETDEALPIGFGQTISQPSVVAFMFELLDPQPGQKILDIGAGSGWTTALLAQIATQDGQKGKVVAVETIPELKKLGQGRILKYNFAVKDAVRYELGNGSLGFVLESPFDRILASASGNNIPQNWKQQLNVGGIIVAPIKNSIWKIEKTAEGSFVETEYPGFVFVPLT